MVRFFFVLITVRIYFVPKRGCNFVRFWYQSGTKRGLVQRYDKHEIPISPRCQEEGQKGEGEDEERGSKVKGGLEERVEAEPSEPTWSSF